MVELYRIEGTFRYEGKRYECDVCSYGTLEVCTVPGAPEECDVDLEYVEICNCIEIGWDEDEDEEHEDWQSIELCDLPGDVVEKIEGEALERFRRGDYKEVCLVGTRE